MLPSVTAPPEDIRCWLIMRSSSIGGLIRRRCAQALSMGKCGCAREHEADEAAVKIEDVVARHIGEQHRISSVVESRSKSFLITVDYALRQTFHSTSV